MNGFSIFYFGMHVNSTNLYLNINEGAGELIISISVASYSLTDFLTALKSALNSGGTLLYDVTLDRDTRQLTISADGNFDILIFTGAQKGSSIYALAGFTQLTDLTGASTYTGLTGAGYTYEPQFRIQDYVAPGESKEKISTSVNESGSGDLEIVTFGLKENVEMSFKFINDTMNTPGHLKGNPNAIAETKTFLTDLIERGPVEFMENINSRASYLTLVLEKTPSSSDGVGYKLEKTSNLDNFYEIGPLVFRVL